FQFACALLDEGGQFSLAPRQRTQAIAVQQNEGKQRGGDAQGVEAVAAPPGWGNAERNFADGCTGAGGSVDGGVLEAVVATGQCGVAYFRQGRFCPLLLHAREAVAEAHALPVLVDQAGQLEDQRLAGPVQRSWRKRLRLLAAQYGFERSMRRRQLKHAL